MKTWRNKPNCFFLHKENVKTPDFYIIVYLNDEKDPPGYFKIQVLC